MTNLPRRVALLVLCAALAAPALAEHAPPARRTVSPEAGVPALLVAASRWDDLADLEARALSDDPTAAELARAAVAAHLARRRDDVDLLAARLVDRASRVPAEASAAAGALLLVDRNDAALDVLRDSRQHKPAYDLLVGEMRLAEALELPADPGDADLEIARAHAHAALGDASRAQDALVSLAGRGDGVATRALRELDGLGLSGVALDRALALAAATPGAPPNAALDAFFPGQWRESRAAWRWLQSTAGSVDATEGLDRVAAMLDPARPSPDADALLARGAALAASSMTTCDQKWMLDGIAGIADLRGRMTDAIALTRAWADATDSDAAWQALGSRLLDAHDWSGAADAFGRVASKQPNEAAPAWLASFALDRAGRAGDAASLAATARERARADEGAWSRLAFAMERTGELAAARRERELLLSIGSPDAPAVVATAQLVARQAECARAHAQADELFQRAIAMTALSGAPLTVERAACVARLAQAARLEAAADSKESEGRIDDALALADHALEPFLSRLDATADLLRVLEDAGRRAEANALFARVFDRLSDAAARFPASSQVANSAAWLSARTGRELAAAEAAARRAVELAPRSPACLDTLAEVLFQKGDRAGALDAGRKAAEIGGKGPYYQSQLERFASGEPTSRPALD